MDSGFEEGIRRGWHEDQQRAVAKTRSGSKVGMESIDHILSPVEKLAERARECCMAIYVLANML